MEGLWANWSTPWLLPFFFYFLRHRSAYSTQLCHCIQHANMCFCDQRERGEEPVLSWPGEHKERFLNPCVIHWCCSGLNHACMAKNSRVNIACLLNCWYSQGITHHISG
jgi:hypothetical protein